MSRIAIVQPSSPPKSEDLELGLEFLRKLGFNFKSFVAGETTSEAIKALLLAEVMTAYKFDYLMAVRGGSGAIKLLPFLEENLREERLRTELLPSFVGFSDITILHCYLWTRFRKTGIHGPMVVNLPYLEKESLNLLRRLLMAEVNYIELYGQSFQQGRAEGRLFGGNLATFASLCGTPYLPQEEHMILFFEDTGEELYRLERALTQILLSLGASRIKGLVLGDLGKVNGKDLIAGMLRLLPPSIPIGYGYPFGHTQRNHPLIFGAKATLICSRTRAILTIAVHHRDPE